MDTERISSSRTNLFKIVSIAFSILLIYWVYWIISIGGTKVDFRTVLLSLIFIVLALAFIQLGTKLKSLHIRNGIVIFANIFNKRKIEIPLSEIKPYLIKNYTLDPLAINKFSLIKHENNRGEYDKYLILSPSSFSKNSDVAKTIKLIQEAPDHIPNS